MIWFQALQDIIQTLIALATLIATIVIRRKKEPASGSLTHDSELAARDGSDHEEGK